MNLTRRQLEALRLMRDNDEELVYERGECYVDSEKFGSHTFYGLLRVCAITHDCYSADQGSGGMEIYSLNETGRNYLKLAGI